CAPGTRIGGYEVVSAIGAGGMGEVYRARDTRLHRDVALKVLPEAFASDPDRLARFEGEAQALAALNHPLIAQIQGVQALECRLYESGSRPGWRPLRRVPASHSRRRRERELTPDGPVELLR